MKFGMNMLLWTGHVSEDHVPILKALNETGFDSLEVPVSDPSYTTHYRWRGGVFSGNGPTEAGVDRYASVHRANAPKARAAGLLCALEPLNRFESYFVTKCEQTSAYLKRLGEDGFSILYGTFHTNIEENDPMARAIGACAR